MNFASKIRGSVLTLVSGAATAQLVLFLAVPVLTRQYDPAAFGRYAMLSMALSLITVFATGKYELGVLLPREDRDAWHVVCVAMSLAVAITAICGFVLSVAWAASPEVGVLIAPFMSAGGFAGLVGLCSAMLVLSAWQVALFVWMNRRAHFRAMSFSRIGQSVVMVTVQIAVAECIGGVTGLLTGTVCGLLFSVSVQIWILLRATEFIRPEIALMRSMVRAHSNLPLHTISTDLIGTLLAQFPIYFLGHQFSETAVGYYSMAQRTLLAPMQLIGNSVGEVFRREASAQFSKYGQCSRYFLQVAAILSGIAVLAAIVVIFFGPAIFEFVFGHKWRIAGDYAAILIFMFSMKFVVGPISFMFMIANKTRLDFQLHLLFFALLIGVFKLLTPVLTTVEGALALFVTVYSVMYGLYLVLSFRFSQGKI